MIVRLGILLFGGLLMGLAPAPLNFWPLAYVALVPLWVFLRHPKPNFNQKTVISDPIFGLIWGIGYHGLALFWITGIHPMTWLGVPWLASLAITLFCWIFITLWGAALVAIWAGLQSWLWQWISKGSDRPFHYILYRVLIGTAIWCALEGLWSAGPLWWSSLSYTQSPHNLIILHLGQISGPNTITAIIVAVNGLIAEAWVASRDTAYSRDTASRVPTEKNIPLILAVCLLLAAHSLGFFLYNLPLIQPSENSLKVGIIQGNIPNEIKFNSQGWYRALAGYTKGYRELTDRGNAKALTTNSGSAKALTTNSGSAAFTTNPGNAKALTTNPGNAKALTTNSGSAKALTTNPGNAKALTTNSGNAKALTTNLDAVLIPETALPYLWTKQSRRSSSFYQAILEKGVLAWVGTFGVVNNGQRLVSDYTNSLFTVTGDGQTFSRYDKTHLVPLGEYIPFEKYIGGLIDRLSPLDAHLVAGSPNQIFETPFGRAIVGICFDSAFAEHFRRQTAAGGEFILTASNDAHYNPDMMWQHHALDVMRAIESDRWTVRATNTGLSAIVDPHGKTLWHSQINQYELYADTIYRRTTKTLYVRWGDRLTPLLLVLGAIIGAIVKSQEAGFLRANQETGFLRQFLHHSRDVEKKPGFCTPPPPEKNK